MVPLGLCEKRQLCAQEQAERVTHLPHLLELELDNAGLILGRNRKVRRRW